MASPPQPFSFSFHPDRKPSFIPAREDSVISTRGQNLPALLQSIGTPPVRRGSSFRFDLGEDVEGSKKPEERSRRSSFDGKPIDEDRPAYERRASERAAKTLMTPQMRSQRLIGNSNPRYKWEQYYKTDEELKKMKKSIREYYARNNYLIQQYRYIDRLLDSSLPHSLIQEYNQPFSRVTSRVNIPDTIHESPSSSPLAIGSSTSSDTKTTSGTNSVVNAKSNEEVKTQKLKRTPQNLYRIPDAGENTPLLAAEDGQQVMPAWEPEEDIDCSGPIVAIAIYINLAANTVLLVMKIVVMVLTSSVSVLASLVDAALDFLSTAIVWTTTRLVAQNDQYKYPVGRRRLEPIAVLVFSVIMITSFVQVAIEALNRLTSSDHRIVELSVAAIVIMASTVAIKFACWLWCRLINNSSVQALAQDAMTDMVFNTFSIIFPLIGHYARIWWLDSLGGIILSLYVIFNWSRTTSTHIRNLSGAAATADERNVLLYLTMRFAKTIKNIQGLQAYHAGDKLNVEVDIVLDEYTSLRDSHDLGESLQYVLESVPIVDRAFVHLDYASYNLPTHMQQ